MRNILISALLISASPAFAIDLEETVSLFRDAEFTCTSGQNHDGVTVSDSVQAQACADFDTAAKELKEAGYCFSATTREWEKC